MAKRTVWRGLTCRMCPAWRDKPSWRVCNTEVVQGAKGGPTALARAVTQSERARFHSFDVSAGGCRRCRSSLREHYTRWSVTGARVERSGDFRGFGRGHHHCRFVVLLLVQPVLSSKRATLHVGSTASTKKAVSRYDVSIEGTTGWGSNNMLDLGAHPIFGFVPQPIHQ